MKQDKRGISLIAVLMFMLAATTASLVVFRWVGSENFASGSRLKQSEAYQASEAGIDAVHSWLTFKAADVGAVLKQYFPDRNPILLNSVLVSAAQLTAQGEAKIGNDRLFNVYLVGADTAGKPFKLKFLSEGKGRDNSTVSQMVVFAVEGLYSMNVPTDMPPPPVPSEYDEDFWGNMGTVDNLQVASAVITQDPSIKNAGGQGLNTIKITGRQGEPGYLVLDGSYYVNNGMKVTGDMYVTGNFDFCSAGSGGIDEITGNLYIEEEFHPKAALIIGKDAFFKGGVNPNTNINDVQNATGGCKGMASGGVVSIGGNCTIQDDFVYWNNGGGGGLGFDIGGNLVMENPGKAITINLGRAEQNVTNSIEVTSNVYLKSNVTLEGTYYASPVNPIPFFGKSTSSIICLPNMTSDNSASAPYYYTNNGNHKIRTNAESVIPTTPAPGACPAWTSWKADSLDGKGQGKDLKSKLEGNGQKSCENTPIQFNKEVYDGVRSTNPPSWVHRADKPGSCDTKIVKETTYSLPSGATQCKKSCGYDKNVAPDGTICKVCNDYDPSLSGASCELPDGSKIKVSNCGHQNACEMFPSGKVVNPDASIKSCISNTADQSRMTAASGSWVTLGTELQKCWNKASQNPNELYDGEWLVVYIKDQTEYQTNPGELTSGKYILVFDVTSAPNNLTLPPTTVNAEVMLYFPNGYPGKVELGGTQLGTGYRYFIFSDGDIRQFDMLLPRKLHGNVFMNNCAVMNTPGYQGNPSFISEGNRDFVRELMSSGILCKSMDGRTGCQDGGSVIPSSSSGEPPPSTYEKDSYLIPVSPRLKVELESKYISKEKVDKTGIPNAQPSILVMPRILYLTTDALGGGMILSDYYTFLYLNGKELLNPEPLPSSCQTKVNESGTSLTLNPQTTTTIQSGVYFCEFSSTDISPFVVQVSGTSTDRKVSLESNRYMVADDDCAEVYVRTSGKRTDCNVTVSLDGATEQWQIVQPASGGTNINLPISASSNQELAYKICPSSSHPYPGQIGVTLAPVSGGGCILDPTKPDFAIIEKVVEQTTVRRVEAPDIEDILSCPIIDAWSITPVGVCSIVASDQWKCNEGAIIMLHPPAEMRSGSCELYTKNTAGTTVPVPALTSVTVPSPASVAYDYELYASYKVKRHTLNIVFAAEDNFTVTLEPTDSYLDNANSVLTCASQGGCTLELYHGQYSFTITGSPGYVAYNNSIIRETDPYVINITSDGTLVVQSAAANEGCVYRDPDVDRLCGNIPFEDLVTEDLENATSNNGGHPTPICIYATSIDMLGNEWNGTRGIYVNGIMLGNKNGKKNGEETDAYGRCGKTDWPQRTCANAIVNDAVPKIDGGYYIYVTSNGYQYFTTTGGTPDCSAGIEPNEGGQSYALTCTGLPTTGDVNTGYLSSLTVSCSDGTTLGPGSGRNFTAVDANTDTSITPSTFDKDNVKFNSAGTYKVNVSILTSNTGNCKGKGPVPCTNSN
ncbi:MAG: hypothetical protein LBB36_05350, partial [Fibromonadaceae bacterium]|nr:hypothetical protein [Fibromonadaceae bacterium]